METKPYSLQAPEEIAKEYGGNKQRIAQAAQSGLLDPTAAVLAGMFIDRMRGAQMEEQGAQRSVAQDVMTPPMPQGAPQAGGGLEALPVPDEMFSGPSMAGGGLVAFAEAGSVDAGGMSQELQNIIRQMRDIRSEIQRPDIPADVRNNLRATFDRLNSKAAALDPQSVQSPLAPTSVPQPKPIVSSPAFTGGEEYGITPEMMTPRTDEPTTMQFLGDLGSAFEDRLREAGVDPEQVRSEPESDPTMDFLKKMGDRLQGGQRPSDRTNFGMTPEGNLGLRPDGSLGLVQDDRPSPASGKQASPTPDMDALQRATEQTGTGRSATPTATGRSTTSTTTPTTTPTARGEESALDQYTKMLLDSIQDKEAGREEARNMALVQAGLGIMGGESPYALQNIARGALPATEAYQQQVQQMRESERETIGDLVDLELKAKELGLTEKRYNDLMKIAQMRGAGGAGEAGLSYSEALQAVKAASVAKNRISDRINELRKTGLVNQPPENFSDPKVQAQARKAQAELAALNQENTRYTQLENLALPIVNAGLGGLPSTTGGAGQGATLVPALPLPESKSELVPNTVYDTARGRAKWDGEQFIPVQ